MVNPPTNPKRTPSSDLFTGRTSPPKLPPVWRTWARIDRCILSAPWRRSCLKNRPKSSPKATRKQKTENSGWQPKKSSFPLYLVVGIGSWEVRASSHLPSARPRGSNPKPPIQTTNGWLPAQLKTPCPARNPPRAQAQWLPVSDTRKIVGPSWGTSQETPSENRIRPKYGVGQSPCRIGLFITYVGLYLLLGGALFWC